MPPADPAHASSMLAPSVAVAHAAGGPLAGLAFAVEDVFAVAGHPPGGGLPAGATVQAAAQSAPAVQALLDTGARLAGRVYADAFGRTLDGAARRHGQRASSSGAALAVAENSCDFGLCADVKGSVMASAGHLGLFGLRCSHDRVALQGCIVPAPSLIAAGIVAREAGILVRVGEVLLGIDVAPLPPQPRLLLDAEGFAALDGETRERFAPVLRRIESGLGLASLVEGAPEGIEVLSRVLDILHGREAWEAHGAVIDRLDPSLGAWIGGERWSSARALTPKQVANAARQRAAFTARLTGMLGGSVLLLPTLPNGAQAGSDNHGGLSLAILSGLPQVSIPIGDALGLSLIGPRHSDLSLARLGARIHGELR